MDVKTKIETKRMCRSGCRKKRQASVGGSETEMEWDREIELSFDARTIHALSIRHFSSFNGKIFRDLSFIYLFYVCFRFVKTALNVYYHSGGCVGGMASNVWRNEWITVYYVDVDNSGTNGNGIVNVN